MKRKALITARNESEFVSKLGRVLANEAYIMVENEPSCMIVEIKDLDVNEMIAAIGMFEKEELNGKKCDGIAIRDAIKDNSKIVEISYEPVLQIRPQKMEIMENTEQEQIKAIKQIIDERVETTLGQVQGRHGNVIKTVDTVITARDIVNAGYSDVSEYKAKIEDLKDEIIYLERKIAIRDKALSDRDKEIERIEGNQDAIVTQAKINVLNELKKKHGHYTCFSWNCDVKSLNEVIDELIKEIRAQ